MANKTPIVSAQVEKEIKSNLLPSLKSYFGKQEIFKCTQDFLLLIQVFKLNFFIGSE